MKGCRGTDCQSITARRLHQYQKSIFRDAAELVCSYVVVQYVCPAVTHVVVWELCEGLCWLWQSVIMCVTVIVPGGQSGLGLFYTLVHSTKKANRSQKLIRGVDNEWGEKGLSHFSPIKLDFLTLLVSFCPFPFLSRRCLWRHIYHRPPERENMKATSFHP